VWQIEPRNRSSRGELDRAIRIETLLNACLRWLRFAGVTGDARDDPVTTARTFQIRVRQ